MFISFAVSRSGGFKSWSDVHTPASVSGSWEDLIFKAKSAFVFGALDVDDRMDSLGLILGLIASKVVSTTGEGTVVDILLGIVGAVIGGWLFTLFGGSGLSGFNLDSVYSAGIAAIGAIIALALYHAFFRRRML